MIATKNSSKTPNTQFYILVRSWNSYEYLHQCLDSILAQEYHKYTILFVDDASDLTAKQKQTIKTKLKNHISVFNTARVYSLRNAYEMIHRYCEDPRGVVVSLDGDDWFTDSGVLTYLNQVYSTSEPVLTYGDCFIWQHRRRSDLPASQILPHCNLPYSPNIIAKADYRREPFLPLHLRTWQVSVFNRIRPTDFCRPDGSWIKFVEDQAIFYPLLEMAAGRYKVLPRPLCVYNRDNPNASTKIVWQELISEELAVRKKHPYPHI